MLFDDPSKAVAWLIEAGETREIEIGCSRGHFLTASARHRRGSRLLGVEMWRRKCIDGHTRIQKAGVGNAAILCAEARSLLATHLPPGRIDCMHVYYPTPNSMAVPGRPHREPPLLDEACLGLIHRALVPGGEFRLVTDSRRYFQQVVRRADRHRWVCMPWRAPAWLRVPTQVIGTGCESQYSDDPLHSPLTLRLLRG